MLNIDEKLGGLLKTLIHFDNWTILIKHPIRLINI